MNNPILHSNQIEAATFKIRCGDKAGTAFFVKSPTQLYIITANHNINPADAPIYLEVEGSDLELTIVQQAPQSDVAILKPVASTDIAVQSLSISLQSTSYDAEWETFGYLSERLSRGARFNGKVSRLTQENKNDIELECSQYGITHDFGGLSGSPLVIDRYVRGIIIYDMTGTLAASGIKNIVKELTDLEIPLHDIPQGILPQSIEEYIADTTPNDAVLKEIDQALNDTSKSYIAVTGSPGSGKTTIAAQFTPDAESNIIIDRYFVKVPDNDLIPTSVRATPEYFMRWTEEVIHRILFNTLPQRNEKPTYERLQTLFEGLKELGNHYLTQNKTGIIIIDGIDDINQSDIDKFFSILPVVLPAGLKIMFSCTRTSVLPLALRSFTTNAEIQVLPLPLEKVKEFISMHLSDFNIAPAQISELANKSEGHPLYLRYLLQYVLDSRLSSADMQLDEWMDTIPVISGNIEIYYNRIWNKFENNKDEIYLAAILAKIRQPISKEELFDIIPTLSGAAFLPALNKIGHLLKTEGKLSVYHTSFSEFINRNTTLLDKEIHDIVANYCLAASPTFFTVSELIFHLGKGSQENKSHAVKQCDQNWVDQCALFSVVPDLVLADIFSVISIASELGRAPEVISLLLLAQRVNFRYNTLFNENALFLVNALLSICKPDEAIRYVIRNKILTVGDGDAIYLLQQFYEYGYEEQANTLLTAIEATYTKLLNDGLDSDTFNRFITLKFRSLALESNSLGPKNAYEKFRYFKKTILNFVKKNGNNKSVIDQLQDEIEAYHSGYLIWQYSMPSVLKEMEEKKIMPFDNTFPGKTALSIIKANEFKETSPILGEENSIADWVSDIEYLLDTYGLDPHYNQAVIAVLIKCSERTDLAEKYIKLHFSQKPSFILRNENGVDFNVNGFFTYTLYAECMGYLDKKEFPDPIKISHNWEHGIEVALANIWFLSGKLRRYKADKRTDLISGLQQEVLSMFEVLSFSLSSRMHWDRSYALPESLIPQLYKKLILILDEFFPSAISVAIEPIVGKTNYQLGLYSEGYYDSLFAIAKALAKNTENHLSASQVTKVLAECVLTSVENRWERNEYLLRLVQLYAQLENMDKANATFKEMIAYSMGPSWYKEAQLGIINSVISNIRPNATKSPYLKEFAAHLQHASGEMTFQRYVRQQQEKFVGDLAKAGHVTKAIRYLKFQLLPDFQQVINNAESGTIDMPEPGKGYILGARSIDEQSAILDLLSALQHDDSPIAWALCELWTLGDSRYLSDFIALKTAIIKKTQEHNPAKASQLLERMARFIVAETDRKITPDYLNYVCDYLDESHLNILQSHLNHFGFTADLSPTKEPVEQTKNYSDPLEYLKGIRSEAELKIKSDNTFAARKLLIESLSKLQENKYSVWFDNYSDKINVLRDLLPQTATDSSELIKELKPLLLHEPYTEEWIIADKLLFMLKDMLSKEEKEEILYSVSEHINLMVHTPTSVSIQYDWLQDSEEPVNHIDDSLLELLIWFLNHPVLIVKNRTIELLAWTAKICPDKVLPALVNEMLAKDTRISKELSAAVLHQVASSEPLLFWFTLKSQFTSVENELLLIKHFMIRESLIACLRLVQLEGISEVSDLLHKLESFGSNDDATGNEVVLEEEHLEPIDDYIFELNELGILNKNFCDDLLRCIDTNLPLPLKDTIKADTYISRSFENHNNVTVISQYENILRYALNCSISAYVPESKKKDVANILRFYQPTFPENKLTLQGTPFPRLKAAVKKLFSEPKPDLSEFYNYKYTILHFYEQESSGHDMHSKHFDITAFLIPKAKMKHEDDIHYHYYPYTANAYPEPTSCEEYEDALPLIAKSNYEIITGSDQIPSLLISYDTTVLPSKALEEIQHRYWRHGRNWNNNRLGAPLKSGYAILIPNKELKEIQANFRLYWIVTSNFKRIVIDVFDKRILTQ